MVGSYESDSQRSDVDPEYELGHGQVALNAGVLQTEVAFHPGEVTFDSGARAHQVALLTDEEQVCQKAFALTAQIVIDIDRSVKLIADEGQEPAEVSS